MKTKYPLLTQAFCLFVFLCSAAAAGAQSPPTIAKAFSAATVSKNQSVTLTFTITNPNPATDLTNVSFDDTLPSGLIIANPDSLTPDPVLGNCDPTATTGTITPTATSISLSGGQIPANATCTFSIDVLAISGGDQVNTTGAISSTEGGTGGTATATVTVTVADLTISKVHAGSFQRGQTGTYTITVHNVGSADSDAAVTVTDTLPAGLTAPQISGDNWTCTLSPLQCSTQTAIAAGTDFSPITLTVNVSFNASLSGVTNTATVSGGGEIITNNDTATDPTAIIGQPDLIVTKSHAASFQRGATGTYTITVKNLGPGPTAGTVTMTDSLPSPLTAAAISGTNWTCDLSTVSCTRSDVLAAAGSYDPITLVVNVPANAPGTVINTATVSGGGEQNTINDTASDSTHIGADVEITQSGNTLTVQRGGTTSTTFTVDAAPGNTSISFACSGLPAGISCSFNPASESAASAPVTMTITASGSAALHPPSLLNRAVQVFAALLLPLAGIVHLGGRRRKKFAGLVLLVAMLLLILGLAGCGGHNAATTTPTGSFPFTVTATSGATGHSGTANYTLNVI